MNHKAKPIFVFSLPRSGSTLLVSILSTHDKIAGTAETWLLLPFIYAHKRKGELSEYCHIHAYHGLTDLIQNLPGKEKEYNQYLADFTRNIYTSLAGNKPYFVDKVPRYYFIIPEIADLFPEAKYVFIFRNPVQIYASTMSTWGNSKFSVFGNYFDVTEGPKLLAKGYELLKSKSYAFQYEKFIDDPEHYMKELMRYIGLEYTDQLISKFNPSKLKGRHVDPNVLKKGNEIDVSSTEKWRNVLNTPFRKRVITNYIKNFDDTTLKTMGYNKEAIMQEIKTLETKGHHQFFRDLIDYNRIKLKNRYKRFSYA